VYKYLGEPLEIYLLDSTTRTNSELFLVEKYDKYFRNALEVSNNLNKNGATLIYCIAF